MLYSILLAPIHLRWLDECYTAWFWWYLVMIAREQSRLPSVLGMGGMNTKKKRKRRIFILTSFDGASELGSVSDPKWSHHCRDSLLAELRSDSQRFGRFWNTKKMKEIMIDCKWLRFGAGHVPVMPFDKVRLDSRNRIDVHFLHYRR